MEEDFVSFEIAKKLKEKGFNEPCRNAVNRFGCSYLNGWCEYLDDRDNEFITQKDLKDDCYLLPTISQVLKWLRDNKNIYVTIDVEHENWFEYKIVQLQKHTRCNSTTVYATYDIARLAGIEYVLDNLI
jgi:hypothetical protein